VWSTLLLLILAAVAGAMIIRQQGVSMVARMFDAMGEGRLAISSLADSYTSILAGGLLIVPGFITDAIAIVLLIPPLRALLFRLMLPGIATRRRAEPATADRPQPGRPIVIEGTYKRLDDDKDARP